MPARRPAHCPTCPARPGEYHDRLCMGGAINYSDAAGRFTLPPPRRLLRWADCGPSAEECEGMVDPPDAAGEWTI